MIDKISKECTTCSACINICPRKCIKFQINEEGFNYPIIDKFKCIECNLCEKVCSVISDEKTISKTRAYAVKNKNEEIRLKSTSGGFFSLLANYVLEKNGYVAGATYDDNFVVRHIIINNMSELYKLRGAKYSQSELGNTFFNIRKLLDEDKLVLFSGTPCQCIGLKRYLKKDYSNLITTDLICHGVPSPKVWQYYIDYRSNKENEGIRPIKINMRCKDSGWSHYNYSTEFVYENGKRTLIPNNQDLFMKAFVGNICLRISCSNCKAKGIERITDFTLGDYWGIWNQYPDFDDDKGTSVILTHTKLGESILKELSDEIELLEVDVDDVYRENGSLIKSSMPHQNRSDFLKEITSDNFEIMVDKYFSKQTCDKNITLFNRIKSKLKKHIKYRNN